MDFGGSVNLKEAKKKLDHNIKDFRCIACDALNFQFLKICLFSHIAVFKNSFLKSMFY